MGVGDPTDEPPDVTEEHVPEDAGRELVARIEVVVRDVLGGVVLAGPEISDAAAQPPLAEAHVDDHGGVDVEALAEPLQRHEVLVHDGGEDLGLQARVAGGQVESRPRRISVPETRQR